MFILLVRLAVGVYVSNQYFLEVSDDPNTSVGYIAGGLKNLSQELSNFSKELDKALQGIDEKLDTNIDINAEVAVALIENEIGKLSNRKSDMIKEIDDLEEENLIIESQCEGKIDCSSCLTDVNCVWCFDISLCTAGSQNGTIYKQCSQVFFDTCSDGVIIDRVGGSMIMQNLNDLKDLNIEVNETEAAIDELEESKQRIITQAENGKAQNLANITIENQLNGIVEDVESLYEMEQLKERYFESTLIEETTEAQIKAVYGVVNNSTDRIIEALDNETSLLTDSLIDLKYSELDKIDEINATIRDIERQIGLCDGCEAASDPDDLNSTSSNSTDSNSTDSTSAEISNTENSENSENSPSLTSENSQETQQGPEENAETQGESSTNDAEIESLEDPSESPSESTTTAVT